MVNEDNDKLIEDLKKVIAPVIYDTHREIVMNTPGFELRNSIIVEETTDGFIIGTTKKYAPYVELDTRPHIIKPKYKQALKFSIDGNTIFSKEVHHPGTTGHHMFLRGITFFEQRMNSL
jgi:hypothetical protein